MFWFVSFQGFLILFCYFFLDTCLNVWSQCPSKLSSRNCYHEHMSPFGALPLQCFPDVVPHLQVDSTHFLISLQLLNQECSFLNLPWIHIKNIILLFIFFFSFYLIYLFTYVFGTFMFFKTSVLLLIIFDIYWKWWGIYQISSFVNFFHLLALLYFPIVSLFLQLLFYCFLKLGAEISLFSPIHITVNTKRNVC